MSRGGPRTGAGRKPGEGKFTPGPGRLPQSWRLKLGDIVVLHQEHGEFGSTPQEQGEVTSITRTKLTIRVGAVDYVIVR